MRSKILSIMACAILCPVLMMSASSCGQLKKTIHYLLAPAPPRPRSSPSPAVALSNDEQFRMACDKVMAGNTEGVRRLLKDNPGLAKMTDSDDNTLLHYAAWRGDESTFRIILEQGPNINAKNKLLFTPLHELCRREDTNDTRNMLVFLLERKVDVNALTSYGNSPLDIAEIKNRTLLIPILKNNGGKRSKNALNLPPVPSFVQNSGDQP